MSGLYNEILEWYLERFFLKGIKEKHNKLPSLLVMIIKIKVFIIVTKN